MINPTPAGGTPARLTLKIERVFIAYAPLQHPNRNTPNICTSYIDACRRRDPPQKNKQTCDSFPTSRPAHNHGRWYSMHLLPAQQQNSGAAAHSKSPLSSRFFSRYRARVFEARPPFIHSGCRTCKTATNTDSYENLGLRLFLERSSSPGPLSPNPPNACQPLLTSPPSGEKTPSPQTHKKRLHKRSRAPSEGGCDTQHKEAKIRRGGEGGGSCLGHTACPPKNKSIFRATKTRHTSFSRPPCLPPPITPSPQPSTPTERQQLLPLLTGAIGQGGKKSTKFTAAPYAK